jgi:hypothetical protein
MIGWMKSFIHNRAQAPASLIKGYTIHMLARRAPSDIVYHYNRRFAREGIDMTTRGHLILAHVLQAQRANRPGCGTVSVRFTTRNFNEVLHSRLPELFLPRFDDYNTKRSRHARFNAPAAADTRVEFFRLRPGTPGVTINGYPVRVGGLLGVRACLNGVILYGDITQLVYVRERNKSAVFLQVNVRPIIMEQLHGAVTAPPDGQRVYLEALTDLTHLIKFVPHPMHENECVCIRVYSTTPAWPSTPL